LAAAATTLAALEAAARSDVRAQGIGDEHVRVHRTLHLKYEGTDTTLVTEVDRVDAVNRAFEAKYRQQYGFLMPGRRLVIEAVAVEAIGRTYSAADSLPAFSSRLGALTPIRTNRIYTDGAFHDASIYDRDDLRPGDAIAGPAVIRENNATTVVEPGWGA